MGLSTKHVSSGQDQQGLDWPSWGKDPLQPGGPPDEPPKPPTPPEQLNCPRCSSANTKFCYYNNYNKSQPRHFCKSCKRHWTKGGSLRNVPVGGGRKNKRPRVSNSSAAAAKSSSAALRPNFPASANNNKTGNNNMSDILYQALIGSPLLHEKPDIININNNNNININNYDVGDTSAGQDRNTEFDHHQFSSTLGTFFDTTTTTTNNNPISYQSMFGYDNHYPGSLDSIEESTVTTVNNVPWPGPDTGSSLDLPNNYWSWSEIDVLASSSDHLNLSWDGGENDDDDDHDLEIKLP